MKQLKIFTLFAFVAMLTAPAFGQLRDVTVTVENLSAENGISFAPLRVGFHSGLFDAFDIGDMVGPGDPIVSIAEGGSGSDWFPAFQAADPNAVLGTVVNGGPAVPVANAGVGNMFSSSASNTFRVDTSVNRFFTFANMVVPSNDLFLGNDEALELFDLAGDQILSSPITLTGDDIWNAGSEQAIVANGAFVVGSDNSQRVDENGSIEFSFSELAVYDGAETAAGYFFDSSTVTGAGQIYRITISSRAVPEPGSLAIMGLGSAMLVMRRRNRG